MEYFFEKRKMTVYFKFWHWNVRRPAFGCQPALSVAKNTFFMFFSGFRMKNLSQTFKVNVKDWRGIFDQLLDVRSTWNLVKIHNIMFPLFRCLLFKYPLYTHLMFFSHSRLSNLTNPSPGYQQPAPYPVAVPTHVISKMTRAWRRTRAGSAAPRAAPCPSSPCQILSSPERHPSIRNDFHPHRQQRATHPYSIRQLFSRRLRRIESWESTRPRPRPRKGWAMRQLPISSRRRKMSHLTWTWTLCPCLTHLRQQARGTDLRCSKFFTCNALN